MIGLYLVGEGSGCCIYRCYLWGGLAFSVGFRGDLVLFGFAPSWGDQWAGRVGVRGEGVNVGE